MVLTMWCVTEPGLVCFGLLFAGAAAIQHELLCTALQSLLSKAPLLALFHGLSSLLRAVFNCGSAAAVARLLLDLHGCWARDCGMQCGICCCNHIPWPPGMAAELVESVTVTWRLMRATV